MMKLILTLAIASLTFTAFGISADAASDSRASIAKQILASSRIGLATIHASGHRDNATAHANIVDTVAGRPAHRSCYDGAPCGTVWLDTRMLSGMLAISRSYRIFVSEIAGGKHSVPTSLHYAGRAFDVTIINGTPVSTGRSAASAVMALCRAHGATEVLGPSNSPTHRDHVHCGW